MNAPEIQVMGVYRLPVTEELLREQFAVLYGDPDPEAEKQCRDQLSSAVLIELVVRNRRDRAAVPCRASLARRR